MPQKAIREYDGKRILFEHLRANASGATYPHLKLGQTGVVQVTPHTSLHEVAEEHAWVKHAKLVVKPDQLIKRRGKGGLILLDATWPQVERWVSERNHHEVVVEGVSGVLDHFLVEAFVPHKPSDEYYMCLTSVREGDEILFYHEGGVDVGDVDAKARRHLVRIGDEPSVEEIIQSLLPDVPPLRQHGVAEFICAAFACYAELHFAYLEVNPLVMNDDGVISVLDMAAKIDETAKFEKMCARYWGQVDFPPAFGKRSNAAEEYVEQLDSKTGSSLKLTILNERGRIWTLVAGGGASVVYADTIADMGFGSELANYGEYSGAPSESQTYEYTKTVLQLLTKHFHDDGKVLIIGGGIANFTNVATTFDGVIRAITEYSDQLKAHKTRLFVRRGGPNYQEGLNNMRQMAVDLDLPIVVHGPQHHMTEIVSLALLGSHDEAPTPPMTPSDKAGLMSPPSASADTTNPDSVDRPGVVMLDSPPARRSKNETKSNEPAAAAAAEQVEPKYANVMTRDTVAIVWGMQEKAVQNMLDFDFACKRSKPSVVAMVYPFTASYMHKFYWNTKEILVPVYQSMREAMEKHPEVTVVVNFASFRSVYESTMDIFQFPSIRMVALVAEGVPERRTRMLLRRAQELGVLVIGPATVGGIKPGCFRIGNTGGMLDNILASKLYRPGSVAYVARSGGMSNELNNIVSLNTNGVYEGIAIGGDMYPGSTYMDHIQRYEADPDVKMIVVLGEVGGVAEYEIVDALKAGRITKPIVAWCIGTCAKVFPYEVQFGHAGACSTSAKTTADAKNLALRKAGAVVPDNFQLFGHAIKQVYKRLIRDGRIVPVKDGPPPQIPMDYAWARQMGLIRKPAAFMSSISDERGEELTYSGVPISEVLQSEMGVGGVVGLLWFQRKLPLYFCKFIEMVLQVTADHGPAVSGAHNTIVTARAGKDMISSLVSGLLTIGPRFGGALDGAASHFSTAYDNGLSPQEFVDDMRKRQLLIMGIGHKVKSLENPDKRVELVKKFAFEHFKSTNLLEYALAVEQITTKKKSNLILNVDGAIGVCFVDLLRSCGAFTLEEANTYIELEVLNALFVLGRSIGFIGHFIDQKRLKQSLYRHPTDDISYISAKDTRGV